MQQISDDRIIQAIRDRGLDPTPDLIERTRQQVQARMATSQTPKAVQSADPTRGVAAYDAFMRSQGAAIGRQPKPEEGGGFIDIVQAGGAEGMARMFRTIDFATGMDKEPGGFVEGAQKYFEGVAAAPENQPRAGEEDTFTTNLARAIGNMAAFSIPAIAGGAAGTLIGGPAGTVAGISAATLGAGAAASATGGAVEYVNAYDEVMKSTGDEELATSAGLWAGLGGLTEGLDAALPVLGKIGKVLTRADKATGGAITDGIMKFGAKRMSSAVIGGAAMNFAQETGQEVWSDAVINHFKGNPSDAKEILQSFKQYAWSMGLPSALIGGAFGGLQGKLEQIQGEEEFKKFAAARAEGRVEREGLKPVGVVGREPGTEGPEFVPSDPLFKKTQEELKAAGDAGILREVEAPKELSYLADISEKKGSRVRFVETAEGSAFRGVYDPVTGDILLNVNRPDDAIDFTFGHELGGHALKRLSGDSFVAFRNKIKELDPAGLAAAEQMARERQPGIAENADLVAEEGQSYYIEEVLGPWMRSIAKNPGGAAILENIAVDDRSMFRKIGEVVLDLFNDMGANFSTRRQTLKNLLGTPDLIGSEVAAGRGLSQQKAAQLALSLHGLMEGMDAGVYQRDAHQRRVEEFRARRAKAAQETEAAVKAAQEKRARRAEVENLRAAGLREEEQRRVGEETAREAAALKDREARAAEQLRYKDTLRGYAAEDERRAKRAEREQAAEKKLRELQQATEDARYRSALERYSKERELTEAQRAQFEADFVRVEGMGTAAQQRAALNEMSSPTQRKVAQESGKGTRLESKKDVAARQAEAARLEPIVQENERSEQERRLSEERTRARAAALEQEARLATAEELGARMEAGMAEQEQTAAEREAALAEQAAEQRRGIEAQSVAEARARERAARELDRERKVTGRTQDAWRRYEDASNAYRTGGPIEEGVGSTGVVRSRRVHEIAALERQGLRGDRASHPLSYATVPELRRMLAANLADEKRAAQEAFGDERMAAAYNELQRKARDPNNPEARSARRQLERMWSNLSEDQKLTLTGAGSRRGVFRPFSTEEITDALNARELGQQGKLTDVGMGPRFSMGDVQSRYEAALREVEAFKDGGSLVSDEAWGAIHHKLASERSPNDWMKAVEFSRENGILPYVSAGKYDIPVQINRDIRFSIASPKKGDVIHEGTGLVLNKNGTVTLYYPTTNADARRVIRDRTLVAQNPSSSVLYLTNESNGMKVNAERGVIDQPTDGANVLVNIDPNLLSVAREYPDGRKDYFVPISEGKAFDGKLRQIRLFTLNVERNKAISADITLKKMSDSITKAVSEYEKMDAKAKRARLSEAKRVLREQHNVGKLLTVNKKLEKTEVNESLIQKVGRMVSTAGLGLSSAQRLNKSKLSTCPNAAICKDLCLGETSGLNELYGGVGAQRSGPRLSQYLKTEAMVLHPEEFAVVLYSEIAKLQASAQSQNRISSIRLNVTSDFHPFVWESMIRAFPETIFYDYTKLDSDAIAPNHHITYSSTGLSQIVDGAPVLNQYQNWMKMTRRMNQGFNTAMAFSTREYLPESLIDDVTGVEYKVIDGDDYDARFADKQPDGQPGVIVGLRNKDNTQKPGGPSSVKTNGFFVHYDPAVHGRSLIVLNQDTLQPSQRETNAPQVRPQQQGGVVERPQAPQGGLPAEASGGNRPVEGQAPEARFSLSEPNPKKVISSLNRIARDKTVSWVRSSTKRSGWFEKEDGSRESLNIGGLGRSVPATKDEAIQYLRSQAEARIEERDRANQGKSRLVEIYNQNKDLIDSAHKSSSLSFTAIPVYQFNSATGPTSSGPNGLWLHKSPTYRGLQSSEYKLIIVDGRPAYARKANHWGKFLTNVYAGDPDEGQFSGSTPDQFGRIGYREKNWSLIGGDADSRNSQAGFIFIDDLRSTADPKSQAPEARFSLGERSTAQRDRDYLSAVAAGDMETAQSMVDEAARAAGYGIGPVYHGPGGRFTVFDKEYSDSGAFYFTPSIDIAASFSEQSGFFDGPMKVYLKADRLFRGQSSYLTRDKVIQLASMGYDGAYGAMDNSSPGVFEYAVFSPNQIKSADPVTRDNAGNVIPLSQRFGGSPDVRYSMGGFASFSDALDDVRKRGDIATQSFRTTFVDYLNETKKLLEAAAKAPYQKIEAMQRTLGRRGISSARIKDEVTPRFNKLVDAMRSAGVSHGDVADFMRARVQPIAEKVVKERRSKMDPTGTMYEAQITATEAADIMKRLKAQPNYGDIVRIVKMVDDVNQRALDINLASGKIDRDSYDKMMAQYDPAVQGMANPEGFKSFYGSLESMPERSVVDSALLDVPGIGRGVGRTGRPYRGRTGVLKGSDVELKSPVVNAFVGLQNAVIRGVKSEEQRAYAKLVKDLNDPTFAVIHDTLPTEDVVGSDGYVHRVPKGDWAEQEGWLPYIENGKWKAIEFKGANRLIAEDLKAKTVSAPIRGVSEVTRKVASLMTRLDPTFMLRNIPRDWGWAFLAGTSKYGTAFTKAMASEYKPALKDLWAVKRGGAPSGLLKQYLDAGAEISSMGFKNYEDNLADLEKALSAKDPNLATKIQNTWESWVGETNDVLENATRYAAFRAAVREGKSVGEAMLVAKEGVALNFEQTGRVGRPINSAFAFFNAGVNGTDAIIRLLTKEGDAGTRARRMAASVVGMGIAAELLNRMVSEDGDDEVPVYDNISEFEKNRNFLFMRPDGSYFKVPIPFGFNAVYAFGRNMAAYMSGARSAMAAATDSVSFAMESASPFGSGPMLQVISPTLLDPIVQWKTNETFTGSKIAPDLEQFGRQTKAPHEIFWKNTSDMPKEVAELVAEVTEVGDSGRGFIDFRPDMLEHWASSYMGGVGRAAMDLSGTIGALYKGEAPDAREAFAIRHFIGEASPYAIDKRYRDTRSEIEQVEARYKQLIEEGDRPTALRWRAANAQLFRASGTLKSIERALDKIPNTPENEERRRTIKARLVRQTGYTQE